MKTELKDWDASEHLDSPEIIQEYIQAALDSGDPIMLREALADVAKARGMTEMAQAADVNRQSLYRSLSSTGNPSFTTVSKIIHALGLKLTVAS